MTTILHAPGAVVGLTAVEAARRLIETGPNVLPAPQRPSPLRLLVGELTHFFALLLWCAAVLSFVAGMPQLGVAIIVVVLVNAVFAFVQEQRAERAAERLSEMLPRRVTVLRDGHPVSLDARDVVPGDVVALTGGDRIPADGVLGEADGLLVDESMLTGESVAVAPEPGGRVWGGSFVVAGAGRALVEATGGETRLAGIAALTSSVSRPHSPLAKELDRVVRTVAVMAIGVGAAFFVLSLLIGTPANDGFLFAVGVTVALVPEGLLPTVTLSLAIGAQRMAHKQALVRHLEAVETLGSTTFICTDKTGTLTRNEMNVVEVWTSEGLLRVRGVGYAPEATIDGGAAATERAKDVARAALGCSEGRIERRGGSWVPVGDPMEAAIDALARRLAVEDRPALPVRRFNFDAQRRRESALFGDTLVVKGAPDSVLPRCVDPGTAASAFEGMASGGLRVIAVAQRHVAGVDAGATSDELERELELLGLLAFLDPARPEAADALAACRRACIRVAMITGDHPATARAIASQVGLLGPHEIVLQGSDLPDDEAVLGAMLDHDGIVVSRVAPEDKLRITRALQARGHVVAMTGDGVNDGPALREADIGIAMGRSGTDVAREAADLVLLDDNFATIVAAIEQGRATFANVRRFLTYHLTDNVAEVTPFLIWALSGGRFPLALGVLQILCLDIGTDLLPALLAATAAAGGSAAIAIALAFVSTAFGAAYIPAVAALTPAIVGERDLAAANTVRATVENVAVVIGPAAGGAAPAARVDVRRVRAERRDVPALGDVRVAPQAIAAGR